MSMENDPQAVLDQADWSLEASDNPVETVVETTANDFVAEGGASSGDVIDLVVVGKDSEGMLLVHYL